MKLLVSVRTVDEALQAAAAGADFIDLKEPSAGALGALPLDRIAHIVAALRDARPGRPISATVGDFAPGTIGPVLERVRATAALGVDYVKVGLHPGERALLDALADEPAAIVPVLIADDGLDDALLARALNARFPGVMLDTERKTGASLLECLAPRELRGFVAAARAAGKLSGLAGALRREQLPSLLALGPDFAGFRSAVCLAARDSALDAGRVRALKRALAPAPATA